MRIVNGILADHHVQPRLVRHDDSDWHIHGVDDDQPLATRIAVETAMAMSDADATKVVLETCQTASTSRIVSRLTASAMMRPRRIGRAARAAKARFMRNTVPRRADAD